MSSRNKQLVEFIRQGIGRRYQNAKQRAPWLPEPSPLLVGTVVKKKGEDAIFSQMGYLAERVIKKNECARREGGFREIYGPGQQPS